MCVCVCVLRNYAIADYLQSQGYGETLDSFRRELDTVSSSMGEIVHECQCVCLQKELGTLSKYNGLLEKKWTTVIRLQRKVSLTHKRERERESECVCVTSSLDHGPGGKVAGGAEGCSGGRGHEEIPPGN